MTEIFASMFSRTPEEITGRLFRFRIPWIETEQKRFGTWLESPEDLARKEEDSRTHFRSVWEQCALDRDSDPVLFRIFSGIAATGRPFGRPVVDIASSEHMGLLPYLQKLNPALPCLATDADVHAMRRLCSRLRENFPDAPVAAVCCDALDLPFADGSVPYVTGFCPLTGVTAFRNWAPAEETDPTVRTFRDFTEKLERTAVREVYRVLRPGGLFVIRDGGEFEWEYDLRRMRRILFLLKCAGWCTSCGSRDKICSRRGQNSPFLLAETSDLCYNIRRY